MSVHVLSWCKPNRRGSALRVAPSPTTLGTERKITPLSFSAQAAAPCRRYVLFLSSAKKHAGKQPSVTYQMCLVRKSCDLKPWHSTGKHFHCDCLNYPHLFWREAGETSPTPKLGMCLSALLNPGQSFLRRKRQNLCKHKKRRNLVHSLFRKAWK